MDNIKIGVKRGCGVLERVLELTARLIRRKSDEKFALNEHCFHFPVGRDSDADVLDPLDSISLFSFAHHGIFFF